MSGTMWSDSNRSSAMPRGQREELRPSKRTNRLGDAASALAGSLDLPVAGEAVHRQPAFLVYDRH